MTRMIFCSIAIILLLFFSSSVFAVEQAERISDREIIEQLTRLEENQKAILQRIEDLEKHFEARFEDINKRFEDIGRQLDRIAAIFTALVIAVIGFAYWDRRTIIRKAKEETLAEIRKEDRAKELMNVLLELAKTDDRLAKVLKQFNIL